jgi:hypothetical protein
MIEVGWQYVSCQVFQTAKTLHIWAQTMKNFLKIVMLNRLEIFLVEKEVQIVPLVEEGTDVADDSVVIMTSSGATKSDQTIRNL